MMCVEAGGGGYDTVGAVKAIVVMGTSGRGMGLWQPRTQSGESKSIGE